MCRLQPADAEVPRGRRKKLECDHALKFWFFLARSLGKSKAEAQRDIDSEEFSYWQEFYKSDPWGDDWLQTGLLASLIHNGRPGMKRIHMKKPGEWIPRVKRRPAQTYEEQAAIFGQFAAHHNATVAARKKRRGS